MKYKVVKYNGQYAAGNNSIYFPDTLTDDKEEAETSALKVSAEWHLAQAETAMYKLHKKGDYKKNASIGRKAYHLTDIAEETCRQFEPDFSERDSKGFLA